MQERAHDIGRVVSFAGVSPERLLPFGAQLDTSDGFRLQCISVGHNPFEVSHHIGKARVIGFAQRVLERAGVDNLTTSRAAQPEQPE